MTLESEPLVTVITPVFNGAEFLPKCIESVIAQTYRNWRYLIVNNCSTDRTLQIARYYADRDSRIRVCDQSEFLPIIDNHNRAFALMDPEAQYCKPLMADDWLYPECIAKMVAVAQSRPSIGIVCAYGRSNDRIVYAAFLEESGTTCFLSGVAACRQALLGSVYFFGSPTMMLIRADLIRKRKPFYNPQNLHADTEACYDILQESDFGFVLQILAYVRQHEKSETTKVAGLDSIFFGQLYHLARYGRIYLTNEEYEREYRSLLTAYYGLLAAAALRLRGAGYWRYHRAKMASIGVRLDRMRLGSVIARHALRCCLSPLSTMRSIREWWVPVFRDRRSR